MIIGTPLATPLAILETLGLACTNFFQELHYRSCVYMGILVLINWASPSLLDCVDGISVCF